jgi:hypothetical protein
MLESQQRGIESLGKLLGRGYAYRVENYASALSELSIRAYKAESDEFRIVFQTTFYIQMPTNWQGADFQLASIRQRDDLMNRLDCTLAQKEELLVFTVVPSSNPETFVLCHKVIVKQLP